MSLSLKTLTAALFAILAVSATLVLVLSAAGSFADISDLPEYYAPAREVLAGRGADIYKLEKLGASEQSCFPAMSKSNRTVALYVPPPAVPLIVPVGLVPVAIVPAVWKLLLFVALAASLYIVARVFELSRTGVLWLIALAFISGPAFESLRIDQLAPFLLLAFMGAIASLKSGKEALAGVLLGLLLLKPPQILPFLVYLAGARRFRVLVAFAAAALVLTILGVACVGFDGMVNYFQLARDSVENSMHMQPELAPTLRGQLLRVFPSFKTGIATLATAICLLFQGLFFFAGRKFGSKRLWLEAGLLLAMPLGLLTSVHCHEYDLLLLLPSLVVLLKDHFQDKLPPVGILAGMFGMLVFYVPFSIFIQYFYLLKGGVVNPGFIYLLFFAASLWVFIFRHQELLDTALSVRSASTEPAGGQTKEDLH